MASRKDAMEPGSTLPDLDTTRPHPARMYNAYLGGQDYDEVQHGVSGPRV